MAELAEVRRRRARGAKVIRIADYERKSREPDAKGPRDPGEFDAVIVILPMIRVERSR